MNRARVPLVLLGIMAALPAFAQQPSGETVHVTAIEVIADVRDGSGSVPERLSPDDFELLEDGTPRKIVSVESLQSFRAKDVPASRERAQGPGVASSRGGWQIVIYFETQLSAGRSRQKAARELMRHVDELVTLGTIDVVLADPTPAAVLRNSRDPEEIRNALETVANHPGINQLLIHRAQFVTNLRYSEGLDLLRSEAGKRTPRLHIPPPMEYGKPARSTPAPEFGSQDDDYWGKAVNGNTVKPQIDDEMAMIRRFRTNLASWLGSYRRGGARALILGTNGFDLDPLEFYSSLLDKNDQLLLLSQIEMNAVGKPTREWAAALAGAGWTVVSVPGDTDIAGWLDDASVSGFGRVREVINRLSNKGPKALLYRPLDPLHVVSDETGGSVIVDNARIGQAIERLGDRVVITYQVSRKPDAQRRRIELRARDPRWTVKATQWAASTTPQELAESRALTLLRSELPGASLPIETSVEWKSAGSRKVGDLRATTNLEPVSRFLPAGARGEFRVTFAVFVPPNSAFVRSRLVSDHDMSPGAFQVSTPIEVPGGATRMVLAIEETQTGVWGSRTIAIP